MSKLRSELIRLAYCNDEVRPHLLPLLQRQGAIPYFNDATYYFDELKAFSRKYDLPGWDFVGLYHGALRGLLQRKEIDVIPHGSDMIAKYTRGSFEYYVAYTHHESENGIDAPYLTVAPVLRYPLQGSWGVLYRGGIGVGLLRLPGGEVKLLDILKKNVQAYERDALTLTCVEES